MKRYWTVLFFFVFLFVAAGIAGKTAGESTKRVMAVPRKTYAVCVVLDAGHGGEDGGALASDGTTEKDLNLMIANDVSVWFRLFGVPFLQTRTADVSVCDDGLDTIRARKRSDIMNRYSLVNAEENRILLSIHQNMFSQSRYSGTQVFYSGHIEEARLLAAKVREHVVGLLQPDNTREIKPSGDSIFLLYKAKRPSVLVECGFLSNLRELEKLKTESYQKSMAYAIAKGMLDYLNHEV